MFSRVTAFIHTHCYTCFMIWVHCIIHCSIDGHLTVSTVWLPQTPCYEHSPTALLVFKYTHCYWVCTHRQNCRVKVCVCSILVNLFPKWLSNLHSHQYNMRIHHLCQNLLLSVFWRRTTFKGLLAIWIFIFVDCLLKFLAFFFLFLSYPF